MARGFPYPDRAGEIKEECAKAFLFGCPLEGGTLPYPRLPSAIDAFNFLNHSVPWGDGGFCSQPPWYRQLMSAMDAASSEESRISMEENRKEAEDEGQRRQRAMGLPR
jgi:hypothetical protein